METILDFFEKIDDMAFTFLYSNDEWARLKRVQHKIERLENRLNRCSDRSRFIFGTIAYAVTTTILTINGKFTWWVGMLTYIFLFVLQSIIWDTYCEKVAAQNTNKLVRLSIEKKFIQKQIQRYMNPTKGGNKNGKSDDEEKDENNN